MFAEDRPSSEDSRVYPEKILIFRSSERLFPAFYAISVGFFWFFFHIFEIVSVFKQEICLNISQF